MSVTLKDIKIGNILYRAYMEVREYKVCYVGDSYIFVKQEDDLGFIKVFDFELVSDFWWETESNAESYLSIVNKREGVSIDNIIYRRGFTLKEGDAMEGDVVFESCFISSRFIGALKSQVSIVAVEILEIVQHQERLLAKIVVKELVTGDEKTEPEVFHVERSALRSIPNMFTNYQALYADRYRSAKSNLHELKLMYNYEKPFFATLTGQQQQSIVRDINVWEQTAQALDVAYNAYIEKNKKASTSANAEKDAVDILQVL